MATKGLDPAPLVLNPASYQFLLLSKCLQIQILLLAKMTYKARFVWCLSRQQAARNCVNNHLAWESPQEWTKACLQNFEVGRSFKQQPMKAFCIKSFLVVPIFRCPSNFIGVLCEFDNPCTSNPCENSAVCLPTEINGSFECQCLDGFSGDRCQITDLLACASIPCLNGATCTDVGQNGYQCVCTTGLY